MPAVPDPGDLPPDLAGTYERLVAGAAQVLPAGGLARRLLEAREAGRSLRVKLGIDPSGSELTLGHAVVLRKLRQFQDAGHLAVLIVGDFTGMVGDPTGRSATRRALTAQETGANAATYLDQAFRVLDPDRVEVRRNSEWLAPMTMADVVREASQLTVARLLERDDFARRYAAHEPISLVELLYPLLQGTDSVAVRADVELGGTDQTYNLLVGRDLQRAHGQPEQVVLTLPLLEGLDGVAKMSKSLGNYVGLTMPADEQFGRLMSVPDGLVGRYAALCTDLSAGEVRRLAADAVGGGPAAGVAKRAMAAEVVALYHGAPAAAAAQDRFNALHRDRVVPADVRVHVLASLDPVQVPALLTELGFAPTTSAARRLQQQGAVRVDGEPLPPGALTVARDRLVGRVLQVGRRQLARLADA